MTEPVDAGISPAEAQTKQDMQPPSEKSGGWGARFGRLVGLRQESSAGRDTLQAIASAPQPHEDSGESPVTPDEEHTPPHAEDKSSSALSAATLEHASSETVEAQTAEQSAFSSSEHHESSEDEREKKLDEYADKLTRFADTEYKGYITADAKKLLDELQQDEAMFGENIVVVGERDFRAAVFRQPTEKATLDDIAIDAGTPSGEIKKVLGEKKTVYKEYLFMRSDGTVGNITTTPEQQIKLDNPDDGKLTHKVYDETWRPTDKPAMYDINTFLSEGNIQAEEGKRMDEALQYIFDNKKFPTDEEIRYAHNDVYHPDEANRKWRVLDTAQRLGVYLTRRYGATDIAKQFQSNYNKNNIQGERPRRGKQHERSLGIFDWGVGIVAVNAAEREHNHYDIKEALKKNVVTSESQAA